MTYTFKLARRLAVLPKLAMLTALALFAACMGDTTAPEAGSTSSSDTPVALQVSPQSVTIETGQRVQFRGHTRTDSRRTSVPIAVTWEASGGTILADGLFSSASVGTFKVVGRGRGHKLTDTSIVVVVPPPTDLVRIAVAPDPVAGDVVPSIQRLRRHRPGQLAGRLVRGAFGMAQWILLFRRSRVAAWPGALFSAA